MLWLLVNFVQPCRFTKKIGSVIDHTFCKLSENTSKSYSGILIICNMSDHLPHFTGLDIKSNQQKPPKYIIKEKHDEASLLSFYNEIEISLRNTHFPNELTTDSNVTNNLLEKNILSAKEKHLKHVKTKLNHYKHKKNPWISMGIINSIKFVCLTYAILIFFNPLHFDDLMTRKRSSMSSASNSCHFCIKPWIWDLWFVIHSTRSCISYPSLLCMHFLFWWHPCQRSDMALTGVS